MPKKNENSLSSFNKTYIWLIYLDKTYILFNSGLDFFVSFCDLINSLALKKNQQ